MYLLLMQNPVFWQHAPLHVFLFIDDFLRHSWNGAQLDAVLFDLQTAYINVSN